MTAPTPVETTNEQGSATQKVETPAAVPATPFTPEQIEGLKRERDYAVEQAKKVQKAKDAEMARVHQQYQAQLRATKQAATQTLAAQGVDNPQQWEQGLDVWQKSQMYDQLQAEQASLAEWNGYVSTAAAAAGLDPADPRLLGVTDAVDLAAKIAKAAKEDARKELEAERLAARAAEQAALQARVASGQLDVLSGAPAGAAPSGGSQADKYKLEMLASRGKGRNYILAIKDKYRALGVDVDSISLTRG